MSKIKTLFESLKEGPEKAFENLDRKIEDFGEIEIQDIKDIVYPIGCKLQADETSYIERILIYKEKKGVEGEPWKPTLDTDLMEFVSASQPQRNARIAFEEIYAQGKTTIREMIAMPYGWFKDLSMGGKTWESLKETLNKYHIKFYKEGNVIKD